MSGFDKKRSLREQVEDNQLQLYNDVLKPLFERPTDVFCDKKRLALYGTLARMISNVEADGKLLAACDTTSYHLESMSSMIAGQRGRIDDALKELEWLKSRSFVISTYMD